MNSDKDAEVCPNCGLRRLDPDVCDFCDYRRHEDPDLNKTLLSFAKPMENHQ